MTVGTVLDATLQTPAAHALLTVRAEAEAPPGWADAIATDGWNPLFLSEAWAEYLARWVGAAPRFISVHATDGTRVAAWLVCVERPAAFRRGWRRAASRALGIAAREVVWFAPPVLCGSANAAAVARVLADWLQRDVAKAPFVSIAGGPWLSGAVSSLRVEPWATYLVDCWGPEDELWHRLKHSARKSIRKAQERGITVRRLQSRDELRAYRRLAAQATRTPDRTIVELDLASAWDCLRPQGQMELFVAELDGAFVSGLGVWGQGAWISEFGSYQSVRDRAERLSAQDLIKWEVIRWARSRGIRWFDLAGVSPQPATPKQAGIRQFKEKWGGRYAEFPRIKRQWLAPRWTRPAA